MLGTVFKYVFCWYVSILCAAIEICPCLPVGIVRVNLFKISLQNSFIFCWLDRHFIHIILAKCLSGQGAKWAAVNQNWTTIYIIYRVLSKPTIVEMAPDWDFFLIPNQATHRVELLNHQFPCVHTWKVPKIGVPQIIHFSGLFHYKSSIWW